METDEEKMRCSLVGSLNRWEDIGWGSQCWRCRGKKCFGGHSLTTHVQKSLHAPINISDESCIVLFDWLEKQAFCSTALSPGTGHIALWWRIKDSLGGGADWKAKESKSTDISLLLLNIMPSSAGSDFSLFIDFMVPGPDRPYPKGAYAMPETILRLLWLTFLPRGGKYHCGA